MPPRDKEKIKVGILLDSYSVPAWEYRVLERIVNSKVAKIEIIANNNRKPSKSSINEYSIKHKEYFLYNLFTKIDDRFCKIKPDAFEIKNATDLLAGIPEITLASSQNSDNDYIEDEDIKKFSAFGVDVFIQLGIRKLRGETLKLPRFGVWSYHHGDPKIYKGGPAGFWEVFENQPVTGSTLQALTGDSNEAVDIYKSFSSTHWLSVVRNRNQLYWNSSSFVLRKLEDCFNSGEKGFKKDRIQKKLEFHDRRSYKPPTNGKMAYLLLRHIKNYLQKKLSYKLYFEQWQLRFSFGEGISKNFHQFKKLIPPKDRFWADPFIVHKDDSHYIFIEELEHKDNKGYISVILMDENGNPSKPEKILETPYHLSYPFIFNWKNDFYMIPETCENRTIEIHKCTDFPYRWELHKKIFENIDAVDTTLFFHNKKWWLFTNIQENPCTATYDDELFLFHSDDPLSENWTPHPLNPIVSDARKARPAGKIFEQDGNIFRPSQNCGGRYGRGLNFNKILKLNETEYEEVQMGTYEPEWDNSLSGFHHISHDKGLTFIDVCSRRSRVY